MKTLITALACSALFAGAVCAQTPSPESAPQKTELRAELDALQAQHEAGKLTREQLRAKIFEAYKKHGPPPAAKANPETGSPQDGPLRRRGRRGDREGPQAGPDHDREGPAGPRGRGLDGHPGAGGPGGPRDHGMRGEGRRGRGQGFQGQGPRGMRGQGQGQDRRGPRSRLY